MESATFTIVFVLESLFQKILGKITAHTVDTTRQEAALLPEMKYSATACILHIINYQSGPPKGSVNLQAVHIGILNCLSMTEKSLARRCVGCLQRLVAST